MWTLSSTIGVVRDESTKCLYWYGRAFPRKLFDLLKEAIKINDPYVFERMLAAHYGVTMAKRYDFESANFVEELLPEIGLFLYENIFAKNADHSTTHILIRDYARNTIKIAINHHPNLSDKIEDARINPPYTRGGIRRWYQSKDKNEGEYRDGNALVDYYFEKDKMRALVFSPDKHNPNKDYKKALARIRWRAYKLGYDFNLFENIDKSIARYKHFENEYYYTTTKYGEKHTCSLL